MNAITAIERRATIEDLWSPEERAHRAAISIHCPNENDFRMGLRVKIAATRDQASAGMRRCCDDARTILAEVARIASLSVYAQVPTSRLALTQLALDAAMDAARMIERANR